MRSDHMKSAKRTREAMGLISRLLIGIAFISPLLIGFLFSFLPNDLLDGLPNFGDIFTSFTFENYQWVFRNISVFRFVSNSLVMCAIIIAAQIVLSSFAAYAFSFFKFRGRNLLFQIILIAMMIPGQVTVIANFLLVRDAGLSNTFIGLCVPYLIGGTAIFMMRQYYMTIPKELKEASLIDGCGDMRFLFRIAVPLSIPTIAALSIYLFIDVYNMYFWPMLIAQENSMQTIQIGMSMLVSSDATQYGRILAGAMISIFIPMIAFLVGQDYLIKGMTAGAVKG